MPLSLSLSSATSANHVVSLVFDSFFVLILVIVIVFVFVFFVYLSPLFSTTLACCKQNIQLFLSFSLLSNSLLCHLLAIVPLCYERRCFSNFFCKPKMLALKVNSHCMVGVYNSSGPPKAKTSGRNSQRGGPSNNLLLATVMIIVVAVQNQFGFHMA